MAVRGDFSWPPVGRFAWPSSRLAIHDRGKVLVHAMLMLAGGGEACSDIEALRAQPGLFGSVPSDSTLYRSFRQIAPATLAGLREAMAGVRAEVWARSSVTNNTDPVILDIDATLVEIHSENKQGTAPAYKRGFGFHPMFCFADATGEALAARLRPVMKPPVQPAESVRTTTCRATSAALSPGR